MSWDESFLSYDFGVGHPMSPVRLLLTSMLTRDLGLLEQAGVRVTGADPAPDDVLQLVHSPDFVAAVKAASGEAPVIDIAAGLGTPDVPIFRDMHEASARIAAASHDVALAVWNGEAAHGVNFAGGLHHAMEAHASGFCVYNDAASRSRPCSTPAPSGSPTSTSTCITATGWSGSSGTTPGC